MILFSKDLFGGIAEVRDIYSATCYTQNKKTTKKQTMIHCLLLFKLIASNAIASVVSIVLQNHYFHDICIFSKKNIQQNS